MNFDDTPVEAAFRARANAWLAANAEARTAEDDPCLSPEDLSIIWQCKAWQARKADAGWACIGWPQEYGGRGASAVECLIWSQVQSKFRVPPDIFRLGHAQAGPTLMAHGTAEQKARFLPRMLRGEEVWCQLFSEPGAGSDLAGLGCHAAWKGDHWIVNGQKTWTSLARISDWAILLARTDPNVPKHAGLTYFVLDMKSPGIEVRPIRQIWGTSDFCEVFLTDVRIPDLNRIADVGKGWAVAMTTLLVERAAVAAGTTGPGGERLPTAQDIFHLARKLCVAQGTTALDSAFVRHKLADYYVRWKGLEYTAYRIMTAISHGQPPGPEAAIGKLVEGRLQQDMASLALDLIDSYGIVTDEDGAQAFEKWQRAYLVAPAIRIAGGTDEILRNIIAERVLGMPAEPRVDKNVPFRELRSTVRRDP